MWSSSRHAPRLVVARAVMAGAALAATGLVALSLYGAAFRTEQTPWAVATLHAAAGSLVVLLAGGLYAFRLSDRMVRRLQAEEARYRGLFEGTPDAAFVADARTGVLVDVNARAVQLTGRARSELVGAAHDTLYPEDLRPEMRLEFVAQVAQPSTGECEAAVLRADGTRVPVAIATAAVRFAGRDHLVAFVRDVTDQKTAERIRERIIAQLQDAVSHVKTLTGLLPICANCKNIRDDDGYWQSVEQYVTEHSNAQFSHSVCPGCMRELYPELADKVLARAEDRRAAAATFTPVSTSAARGTTRTDADRRPG